MCFLSRAFAMFVKWTNHFTSVERNRFFSGTFIVFCILMSMNIYEQHATLLSLVNSFILCLYVLCMYKESC